LTKALPIREWIACRQTAKLDAKWEMPLANAFDAERLWLARRPCRSGMKPMPGGGLLFHHKFPEYDGMKTVTSLAARLASCRALPGVWDPAYDRLIARLRAAGAIDGVPKLGDVLPDFALADVEGNLRRLSDLVADGPAVISFNRGSWCPFCSDEIAAWAAESDQLAQAGARMILITPEIGGKMQSIADQLGPSAVVLCDVDLGVALRFGLAFPVSPVILSDYVKDGLDLAKVNGSANGFLPVPATFLVDARRQVHFAFADADFSQRAEPADVLAALQALTAKG
jgi:peroxiredoxin